MRKHYILTQVKTLVLWTQDLRRLSNKEDNINGLSLRCFGWKHGCQKIMNKKFNFVSLFRYGVWGLAMLNWMVMTAMAEEAKKDVGSEQNIKITADSLECDQNRNVCIAIGKAAVEKVNDPDKRMINAEHIEMFFEKTDAQEEAKTEAGSLSSGHKAKVFHANGEVVITIKHNIIRGDKGVYTPDTEIAEVYGNVSVTSGRNEVVGDYGWANLKTGEYKIRNSKGRVTALIFQDDKMSTVEKQKNGNKKD